MEPRVNGADDEWSFDPAEYDEIFSAYVGAKAHLNKIRTSRGFYPVAAIAHGPHAPRPSHRPQDKGKVNVADKVPMKPKQISNMLGC